MLIYEVSISGKSKEKTLLGGQNGRISGRNPDIKTNSFLAYDSVFLYNQKINMRLMTSEQVDLFQSLFRGRQDVYARYWEKGDHSGYSPAYEFDWAEFRAFKNKGGTLKDFPNKSDIKTIERKMNIPAGCAWCICPEEIKT